VTITFYGEDETKTSELTLSGSLPHKLTPSQMKRINRELGGRVVKARKRSLSHDDTLGGWIIRLVSDTNGDRTWTSATYRLEWVGKREGAKE
jgi:hypothetical protein